MLVRLYLIFHHHGVDGSVWRCVFPDVVDELAFDEKAKTTHSGQNTYQRR